MIGRMAVALPVALALAGAYVGWTWIQRHEATLRMERAHRTAAAAPAAEAGDSPAITAFYARAGEMTDAERNLVCYGVRNARSVRLDPPVEQLEPARNRCFWVEPRQDTTYTLFVEGLDGREESASFRVRVRPAPAHIDFVAVSHSEVKRGEPVTVCYGVVYSDRVRLDPMALPLPAVAKNCTRFYPAATLRYTLTAFGREGSADRERFAINVR
jgi:hypothetical protein